MNSTHTQRSLRRLSSALVIAISLGSLIGCAQARPRVVVHTKPAKVIVKPARPAKGNWAWVPGHWVKQPQQPRYWVSGHWKRV
jgi:hypothetical protein